LVGLQTQVSNETLRAWMFVAGGNDVVPARTTDHSGTTRQLVDAQYRSVDDAARTSAMRDVSKPMRDSAVGFSAGCRTRGQSLGGIGGPTFC
jgi:hypothetical protein